MEYSLPQLVGELDPAEGRSFREIEFTLPVRPLEVRWVELRLRGSSFPGAIVHHVWDEVSEAYVPEVIRIPTALTAYVPTSAGEWVVYSGSHPAGVFDRTLRFQRNPGADRDLSWDFLREGRGVLMLHAEAPLVWGDFDPLLPPSKVEIEKAVLIVEGRFPKPKR